MRLPRLAAVLAPVAAATLAGACVPHQTRRPGSDLVIVRRSVNLVAAVARTQCRTPPAATVPSDSLAPRQTCAAAAGDSLGAPGRPSLAPPQRVP